MLNDFITPLKSLFPTGIHTVLRAQENRERRIGLVSGNLVTNLRSDSLGVCARMFKNGVYGFSSIAEASPEGAKKALSNAENNLRFLTDHTKNAHLSLPALPTGFLPSKQIITDTKQNRYIDFLREMDDYILRHYRGLTGRRIVMVEDSMEKILCTSDGFDGHITAPRSFIYTFLNTDSHTGLPLELFKAQGGYGNFEDVFDHPDTLYPEIDRLYEQLMRKREGVYTEAGYKTVILGSDLAGMLAHEAVGHTVEADFVLGGSVAGSNLGKQVASELVTLVDFAHTAFGKQAPLPVWLDDEGTPAKDETIIQNGILTGYMNNRQTAANFEMQPSGNARARFFYDEPLIRMRNTAILPGKDKLEEMIASVEDGYYLLSTDNGQADITGEFTFDVCSGYEIKNGKLARPILDTTISGVAFDMLKTVDMVSDSLSWTCSGNCEKKQQMPVGMGGPALRCKVMIGGR